MNNVIPLRRSFVGSLNTEPATERERRNLDRCRRYAEHRAGRMPSGRADFKRWDQAYTLAFAEAQMKPELRVPVLGPWVIIPAALVAWTLIGAVVYGASRL